MAPTKHLEVFQRREECRAALLELRRTRAVKEREAVALLAEVESVQRLEGRERARLIELTREAAQLLHADTTGLLGAPVPSDVVEPEPVDHGFGEVPPTGAALAT